MQTGRGSTGEENTGRKREHEGGWGRSVQVGRGSMKVDGGERQLCAQLLPAGLLRARERQGCCVCDPLLPVLRVLPALLPHPGPQACSLRHP